ncbi:MAG: prepilin-type N-terminal cleavage/methylation domain-containing protein [Pseudomonadota bacterium]
MSARRVIRKAQAGFSLLEVLIVVSILSVAAYVALDAVDHDSSELRYNLTETRLEKIRRAIVGDPSLTVNGSPMISGYVADVGQLPPCLEALFVRDADCNPNVTEPIPPVYATFNDAGGNDANTAGAFVDSPAAPDGDYDVGEQILLTAGWRGPYLSGDFADFADAWGNARFGTSYPAVATDPHFENGWRITTASDDFTIESIGRDRSCEPMEACPADAAESISTNILDADASMTDIDMLDWLVDLAGLQVSLTVENVGPSIAFQACFGVIMPDRVDPSRWALVNSDIVETDVSSTASVEQTISHTFGTDDEVTLGRRSIIVYAPAGTPSSCNFVGSEPEDAEFKNQIFGSVSRLFVPRAALEDASFEFEN